MPKAKFCVVVPAFNEKKVIESSIKALKQVIHRSNIYVVSDGSTDNTVRLSRRMCVNVLSLRKNHGKAGAIFILIKKFKLTRRYQYILFSDADSRLKRDFFMQIKTKIKSKPACLVGAVQSHRKGFVSAFRFYEYALSNVVFKNAQNTAGVITVAPGCAALYRSDVLEQLDFSHHTLTEDFDFTIQIHQKKLGQIIYVPQAQVTTQDPMTLKDYWNQVLRWYTGFWQNFFIHRLYLPTKKLNFEIYILLLDLFIFLATAIFALSEPAKFLHLVKYGYLSMIGVFALVLAIQKQFWAIKFVLFFPLFYAINLMTYSIAFLRAIFGRKKNLSWRRVMRYKVS